MTGMAHVGLYTSGDSRSQRITLCSHFRLCAFNKKEHRKGLCSEVATRVYSYSLFETVKSDLEPAIQGVKMPTILTIFGTRPEAIKMPLVVNPIEA